MREFDVVPTVPARVTAEPAVQRAATVAVVHRDDLAGVSRDATRELLDMLGLLDTARGMRGVDAGPQEQPRHLLAVEARRRRRAKARDRAREEKAS